MPVQLYIAFVRMVTVASEARLECIIHDLCIRPNGCAFTLVELDASNFHHSVVLR